jgi:formylglycine-generating enzyme required for sulfatase activity
MASYGSYDPYRGNPTGRNPDTLIITEPIRMELVRVPAGKFLMGSDKNRDSQAFDDETPQYIVDVAEYYIGKYPVTNAQYAVFAKATGRKTAPTGMNDYPVVNVS